MNNTLVTTICIAAALVVSTILFKECGGEPPTKNDSLTILKTEIARLRNIAKQYEDSTFHDTIIRIQTAHRNRILQVDRWVYNPARSVLCDSFAGGEIDSACFRILARRLATGEYHAAIIPIYQAQRGEDSSQIAVLMQLDSLSSEAIKAHENNEKAFKGEMVRERRKSVRKAAMGAIGGIFTGFIIGKL